MGIIRNNFALTVFEYKSATLINLNTNRSIHPLIIILGFVYDGLGIVV